MRPRFVFLFILLFNLTLTAKANIDSLLQVVAIERQDTNTVNALIKIATNLRSNHPDSAQIYAEKALQVSRKINFPIGIDNATYQLSIIYYFKDDYDKALAYININKKSLSKNQKNQRKLASTLIVEGNVHKNMGNYLKATQIYDECLEIAKASKDNHLWVIVSNNKANIFRRQGKYNVALKIYLEALKICEDNNLESDKVLVLVNIGLAYKEQKKYAKALKYYEEVLTYHEKNKDKRRAAIVLNNIGNVYCDQENFNKALIKHQEAYQIREELGDLSGMASSMLNIGGIYLEEFRDYDKALEYAQKSLKIKQEIKAKEGIADSYITIAQIYAKQKKFEKAIDNANKGLQSIEDIGELQLKQIAYRVLSKSYQGMQNYEKALEYFKEEQVVNDSIFSKTNRDAINELTEKYQFEKQEEQLARQQVLLKKERSRRSLLIGIIILLIALGIMSFYVIRQKHSLNQQLQQLNEEVNAQNEELHLAQNRLKLANQDLQSFTSMASHDLKEPLRMMGSFSQLLRRRNKNLDESSLEYIEYITDAAQRMTRMLNDMLSYATNTILLENFENLNTNEILETVQKNLQFVINENDAKLIIEKNLPSFKGQASLMEQVFQNLIANAIKFQHPNITPQINIKTETTDKNIIFKIIDNGIGIAPENRTKIFQLFKRFNKEYEGSGIGLATCKKIVELHNGTIEFESEIGKGTTFILTFPK